MPVSPAIPSSFDDNSLSVNLNFHHSTWHTSFIPPPSGPDTNSLLLFVTIHFSDPVLVYFDLKDVSHQNNDGSNTNDCARGWAVECWNSHENVYGVWYAVCYHKIIHELMGTEIRGGTNEYERQISEVVDHEKEGPGMVCCRHQQTHLSIRIMPRWLWQLWRKVAYNLENESVFGLRSFYRLFVENGSATQNFWSSPQRETK